MAFSVQSILNVASIAGGSCAIGLPVALHSINLYESKRKVSLTQCESNNNDNIQKVEFGDKNFKDVCGYVQSSEGNEQKLVSAAEDYTNLFKERGDQEDDQDGNFYSSSNGVQQCESVQPTGGILTSQGGVEYLGLCRTDSQNKIPFVKKQKEESENRKTLKLWVCNDDCGDESATTSLSNTKFGQKQKENNGKEVLFRKK